MSVAINPTTESSDLTSWRETVRARPTMYLGNGAAGFHKLIYTVVENAIGKAREVEGGEVTITLHADQSITVADNGVGMQVGLHPIKQISLLEMRLTMSRPDDSHFELPKIRPVASVPEFSVANILSEWLVAEVHREGQLYRQRYEHGVPVTALQTIGATTQTGTSIHFKPDSQLFSASEISVEQLAPFLDERAVLNRGLRLKLLDQRVTPTHELAFHYEEGIISLIKHLNRYTPVRTEELFYLYQATGQNEMEVEIALQYCDNNNTYITSYVNQERTPHDGTHVQGLKEGLVNAFRFYLLNKGSNFNEKYAKSLTVADVCHGLTVVVSVYLPQPEFQQAQRKALTSAVASNIANLVSYSFLEYLNKNSQRAHRITYHIERAILARLASEGNASPSYLSGFGNEFVTEAVPGALPKGQNSPQRAPLGLYAEQFSGTAFTAPRDHNLRSWLYRIRPSVLHHPFKPLAGRRWLSAPFPPIATPPTPNQLRWNPLPIPDVPTDFIDGMVTVAGNGDVATQTGIGVHLYAANCSMTRFFYDADGELLIVPQEGSLTIHTELGVLSVAPGEIGVLPRGLKFCVQHYGNVRGYVCENYGAPLRLPELGPIGANGLANPRDFLTPVAAYEDQEGDFRLVARFQGHLWEAEIHHSPLDVVAWHGNYAPYKYDLTHFNTMNSVSFDHPDPSIFTVLTSPSETAGTANVDFVIFPPRWLVAENTFRPPWFHRNFMSEFMGLVRGEYDAKPTGFVPGGASLHNCMSAHGPDTEAFLKASNAKLKPVKYENTLAFMFESRYVLRPTAWAMGTPTLQDDYWECWQELPKQFTPPAPK